MAEMNWLFPILMGLVFIEVAGAVPAGTLPEMELLHKVVLDKESDFTMLWTPRENYIIFEVRAATTGYIGLGFSPSGGMKGADIALGWVDDATGEVFLHDRHSEGYGVPIVDESQDVELLGGFQNDSHTVLRFSRLWNTCDDKDMKINNDTMRVIWAYSFMDPLGGVIPTIHHRRGTKSIILTEPRFVMPQLTDDVQMWDLRMENASLPNNLDTMYWCKVYKFPSTDRKIHVIGFMPLIQAENVEHVHHVVVYQCKLPDDDNHYEKWLNVEGAQCYSANMPPSWRMCFSPILAWGVGSDGEMFPEHVGYPIGGDEDNTYFMMEMHYDNPNLRQDVFDSSGLRVYYTEKLREFDASNIAIGHDVHGNMIIPPGREWLSVGHCVSECTRETLPADGINVFHGLLHSHLLGRNLKLRHIRNGKELPTIFQDMAFDFNYQQHRVPSKEMKILPGDSLLMECGFDSTQRLVPTFGGLGTNEEMCIAFLSYYPRVDLAMCSSRPSIQNIYESVGIEEIYNKERVLKQRPKFREGELEEKDQKFFNEMDKKNPSPEPVKIWHEHKRIVAKAPEELKDMSLFDILSDNAIWEDSEWVNRLQNLTAYGRYHVTCADMKFKGRKEVAVPTMADYPAFIPFVDEMEDCAT